MEQERIIEMKLFYMWKQVENVEQIFFVFESSNLKIRLKLYWYFPCSLHFLENKALLAKILFYF